MHPKSPDLAAPLAGAAIELVTVEPVLPDAVLQRLVGDPEQLGGGTQRAAGSLERLPDQVLLQVGQLDTLRG